MKKLLTLVTALLAIVLVSTAADVTGKWTYEQAGRQGGNSLPVLNHC